MLDIANVLEGLSEKRPLFHSEADFQHALAWEIHKLHPSYQIRLEYRAAKIEKRTYVDIWVSNGVKICALELKYKTKPLHLKVNEEMFSLLNQSAEDTARYDFCKDICRIQTLSDVYPSLTGYAIFLTNAAAYWKSNSNLKSVDSAFRIHDGMELAGKVGWAEHASAGTKKSREDPLIFKDGYKLHWEHYSTVSDSLSGQFRMLVVPVAKNL